MNHQTVVPNVASQSYQDSALALNQINLLLQNNHQNGLNSGNFQAFPGNHASGINDQAVLNN